jgi:hypothetical protein
MAKPNRRRPRTRVRQSAQTGAWEVFLRPQGTWIGTLVGRIIRLRAELTLVAGLLLAYGWLCSHLPRWGVSLMLAAILVLVLGVSPVRRYLVRRWWCVLSRHRARVCFRTTWTMNYDGTLPYLLWSRPTPVGERIRVWLPAGLAVNDLARVADKLAVACWARDCRVEPGRKYAASAMLHLIRRDPLETAEVAPELLDTVDPLPQDGTVVPLPRRDEVTHELARPDPAAQGRSVQRGERSTPKKNTPASEPAPRVEGFGGMDVSDYV